MTDQPIWPDEERPAGTDAERAEPPEPRAGDAPQTAEPQAAKRPDPAPGADPDRPLRERVTDAICTVFDPEIPVNIWELGLIYDLDVDEATGKVVVRMTLTSPACPVAESLPGEVETRIRQVDGVGEVELTLVWEPPWSMEKLSEAAKLQLGLM